MLQQKTNNNTRKVTTKDTHSHIHIYRHTMDVVRKNQCVKILLEKIVHKKFSNGKHKEQQQQQKYAINTVNGVRSLLKFYCHAKVRKFIKIASIYSEHMYTAEDICMYVHMYVHK